MVKFYFLALAGLVVCSCSIDTNTKNENMITKNRGNEVPPNVNDSLIVGNWRLSSLNYAKVRYEEEIRMGYHKATWLNYNKHVNIELKDDKTMFLEGENIGQWKQSSREIWFILNDEKGDFPLQNCGYPFQIRNNMLFLYHHYGDFRYEYILHKIPAPQ